jgi:hypothetical protein
MNDLLFTKKKKMMVGVQEGCQEKGRGRKKRREGGSVEIPEQLSKYQPRSP